MEVIHTINLPAFVRRTMKAYALKAHIRQLDCDLSRIGRSRNWQIKANFSQIQALVKLIEQEQEESWLWLGKLLKREYQHLNHDNLLALAIRLDNLTVTALIALTDCTLAQARKVLDELEDLD